MARRNKNKREENSNKKVKKKSGILKKILIVLIILLLALVGFIAYRTKKNGGGMQGLLSTLVGHTEETLKELEPIQVLLMGVSTDNGGKLTDTIIVGTYDPQKQTASLLSIPRDTFVGKDIKTGGGMDKINALYQKNPEKTLDAVNNITGLDIKYYMVIDNQALIKLVDVIGGVEFDVPINMLYDDDSQDLHINLKKGLQTLDGDKAEQLLRYRHGNLDKKTGKYIGGYPEEYGGNDIGRMKTQRNFIIETAKQTIQAKNVFKVKDIIDIVYEYVETNLSISVVKDYVPYAVNMNIDSIQSKVLPGVSVGPPEVPLWFYQVNKTETAKLIEELYGDGETDETTSNTTNTSTSNTNSNTTSNTSSNSTTTNTSNTNTLSETSSTITKTEASKIKIEILNGSGSDKKLAEVKKALTDKGYKVTKASNTTNTSKTTIINKTDVDQKFENNIKELLGVGNISTSSVSSSNVDITIIIGKDYK